LVLPTLMDITLAQEVLRPYHHHTPLLSAGTLSRMCHANVYLKAEVLQRTGSCKFRGAFYKLWRLGAAARRHGVVAASGGNHAQGVALAASILDVHAAIVMPATASTASVRATREYGAQVEVYGDSLQAADSRAREIHDGTGAIFIHPFDDPDIIAGQGTLGLEILHAWPSLDAIVVAIGGGALISGIALALKTLNPTIAIIGVQADRMPTVRASLAAGHAVTLPPASTIADAINVTGAVERTFRAIRDLVDVVVEVTEDEIMSAMVYLLQQGKLVVEGAGAVGVAALASGTIDLGGKNVVVLLGGGNVDVSLVQRLAPGPSGH
jgi:threonine dehydratase